MTPRTTCRSSRRLRIASGCACVLDDAGTVIEPCYAHLEQKNGSRVLEAERPHQGAAKMSAHRWAREPVVPGIELHPGLSVTAGQTEATRPIKVYADGYGIQQAEET